MIVYIEKLVKAFNMLKDYVRAHQEDVELNEIFKAFADSMAYNASGRNIFR